MRGDSRAEVRRLVAEGRHDEAIAMMDRIMGSEVDDLEPEVVLEPLERLAVQQAGPEHPDWGW